MKHTPPPRGRFIVLEGLDGAGTTTQTDRLAAALRIDGIATVTTREPSNGPIGLLLRQALTGRLVQPDHAPLAPETLALLFAADRIDHLKSEVLPALEAGKTVICDRYLLSSLAYQGASLPMSWVREINREALTPDLTVFVEVTPAVAAQRREGRGGRQELFEADAKQRKIAKQYGEAIRLLEKTERIVSVDGSRSLEKVTLSIIEQVKSLFAPVRKARG